MGIDRLNLKVQGIHRKRILVEMGLCSQCEKPRDGPSIVLCTSCTKRRNHLHNLLAAKWLKEDKCRKCGKVNDLLPLHTVCGLCREYQRDYMERYRGGPNPLCSRCKKVKVRDRTEGWCCKCRREVRMLENR